MEQSCGNTGPTHLAWTATLDLVHVSSCCGSPGVRLWHGRWTRQGYDHVALAWLGRRCCTAAEGWLASADPSLALNYIWHRNVGQPLISNPFAKRSEPVYGRFELTWAGVIAAAARSHMLTARFDGTMGLLILCLEDELCMHRSPSTTLGLADPRLCLQSRQHDPCLS